MRAVIIEPCKPIRILIRRLMSVEEALIFTDLAEAESFSLETDDIGIVSLGLDQSTTDDSATALYCAMRAKFPNAHVIFFTDQKIFTFNNLLAKATEHERNFVLRPNTKALIDAIRLITNPNGQTSSSDEETDEEE